VRIGARIAASFALALIPTFGVAASADAMIGARPHVLVVTIEGAGFQDVFDQEPRAFALASLGGAGLVSQRLSLGTTTADVFGAGTRPYEEIDAGSVAGLDGEVDPTKLRAAFDRIATASTGVGSAQETVIFVSRSPSAADVRAGDELGVVIMATGSGAEIDSALGSSMSPDAIHALTSDSTRRDGAVTTSDIAVTLADLEHRAVPADVTGAVMRTTDAPAPFDLYRRYRDQRRLTVPIGVATAIYAAVAGLFALGVALRRSRTSTGVRTAAAWAGISIAPLGLALLEVGRLPRLTYAGVIPFLAGLTVVLTTGTLALARRRGAVSAIIVLATVVFIVLAVEAAMDWPGAVTPLLGGSQLDGGRFFGLPNAFIGLVLASAVFVALALKHAVAGASLLFVTGLVIGSPWFGSDLGGAITMSAAAGLWWGIRTHARVPRTAIAACGTTVVGAVLVILAQRYLAAAPTHITRFAEGSGHAGGIFGTIGERLRIGGKLLVTHPFAVLPVAGVPLALWALLRPRGDLRSVLSSEPAFTAALITVLIGCVVAYGANDTGASAVGLGFASAVSALLFVVLSKPVDEVVTA
jgi:hypothetical protein